MNFKNKIILFIIIAVLLIAGLLASFLYPYEKYNFFNNPSEEKKLELKTECLEKLDKMNDEQLIEEVNNFSFIDDIEKNTVNYLMCYASEEKKWVNNMINSEIYHRIANLILRLNISENKKKYILSEEVLGRIFYRLDENNNKIESTNNQHKFPNYIALASTEKICPNNKISDYSLNLCLKSIDLLFKKTDKVSEEILSKSKEMCNNLCESIIKYNDNWSNFEKDSKNFSWFDDIDLSSFHFLMKSALAFHVGGKELALELCNSLDLKEECKHYVMSLDYINCKDFGFNETKECEFKKYEDCEVFYNQVKNLMCEFYSEEYNK